jgi:hypothetical protein
MVNNPYTPYIEKFANSSEFSFLGKKWKKDGYYCDYSEGSQDYINFWKEIKEWCINGYTNSLGIKISGTHFFYLNFCPILRKEDEEIGKRKKKVYDLPLFVDLDFEYFWMVEYCKLNEKLLIAVKGRRQGWSFKGAACIANEYTFIKESRCIIGAFLSSYSEGTTTMVKDYLHHLTRFTPFGHIRNPDHPYDWISQYQSDVGGIKIWKGYKSSVEAITFKDRPATAAGKSASIILLDEAGLFPNISESWGFTEPLINDGSAYTGIALIYGSAGDMNSGSKYFYEMFINPDKHNFLSFEDPENPANKIGFFSGSTRGRWGVCKDPNSKWYKQPMVDENGNSNEEAAYDDLMYKRSLSKGGLDTKTKHLVITQYPTNWKEAFLRNKGAIFASPEMLEWLGELETTPSLYNQVEKGELVWKEDKLEFQPKDTLNYITSFPIKPDEDNTGCIAIWERPEIINGEIPNTLYIAGCDPYDMDKSGSGSLGSFYIYKRFYSHERTHDIIVAEFTGRPKFADDFYENCRRLCIYYNAKCLYENQLKGFKNYMATKNSLQYLWEQPDHMIKDIIKDSKVQRGYGCHVTRGNGGNSGIKDMMELYLKDWLYTEKEDINGIKKFNFHYIKSIALLKELIAYDIEGNFDRAIALMLCVLQTKELHKIHAQLMTGSSMSYGNDPFLKKIWAKNTTINRFKFN